MYYVFAFPDPKPEKTPSDLARLSYSFSSFVLNLWESKTIKWITVHMVRIRNFTTSNQTS